MSVRPERGKMIMFYNMLPNGAFDEYSLVRVNVARGRRGWGVCLRCTGICRSAGVRIGVQVRDASCVKRRDQVRRFLTLLMRFR